MVMAESAAIIDYVIRHYGDARLQPKMSDPEYDEYVFWMHYAEGSTIQPILLKVNAARIGKAAAPIEARIERELVNDLGYIDTRVEAGDYLLGNELSGADIQLSFVGELAGRWTDRSRYPNLDAWVRRFKPARLIWPRSNGAAPKPSPSSCRDRAGARSLRAIAIIIRRLRVPRA